MANVDLAELRSYYDEGVILDAELVFMMLDEVLAGRISRFEQMKEYLSPDLSAIMLAGIDVIEAHGYMHPNTFARGRLSDEELKERASRLKPMYDTVFSEIRSFFDDQE